MEADPRRGRAGDVDHPVGYLYRVGQSATRRFLPRPVPARLAEILETRFPDVEPGLLPALARLSEQQRTVVVLVHGYGWRQAEVAHHVVMLGSEAAVAAKLGVCVETVRARLAAYRVRVMRMLAAQRAEEAKR